VAIRGNLEEAALPDILQLLALGGKTGCLSVTDHRDFAHVYFRDGRVVFASLVNRPDRLGERLLRAGAVDRAELEAAVARQLAEPDRRLGDLLVEAGAVTEDGLRSALAEQVEDAVHTIFTWRRGPFHFEPGQAPPPTAAELGLDVPRLLLEGARRADEWERMRARVPHGRLVLARSARGSGAPGAPGAGAGERSVTGSPAAGAVLAAVDGARDVDGVIARAGLDEFRGFAAVHALLEAGLVEVVGESPPGAAEAPARREECRELGLAFARAGMLEEAAREFRQMAALDDRDVEARFRLGIVAFRAGRLDEARTCFAAAAGLDPACVPAWLNLALALEALGRDPEAEAAAASALRAEPDSAAAALQLAILRIRGGAHDEALALLRGLELDGPLAAVRTFHEARLLARAGELEAAEAALRTIPPERRTGRVEHNLGVLQVRLGREGEARLAFDAALARGGAGALPLKALGDLHRRAGRLEQARASYVLALREESAHAGALAGLAEVERERRRRPPGAAAVPLAPTGVAGGGAGG
jgi:tetratricopeptide (TPR) repeat protein